MRALAARGYATVPEPGQRIVDAQEAKGGTALPWVDMAAFLTEAAALARKDLARAAGSRTFFDRGIFDAAVGLRHVAGVPLEWTLGPTFPYARRVVLVPPHAPWFARAAGRNKGFAEAVAEYQRLVAALKELDVDAITLPPASLETRVTQIEDVFGPP